MRKSILYSVMSFLSLAFVITGTSCKKSDNGHTILGTWYDPYDNSVTFNSGGTGNEYVASQGTGSFTWTMPNDNEIDFGGGDIWQISWASSTSLVVVDKGNNYSSFRLNKH